MSLDTEKVHRLKEKGFDKLYKDRAAKWKQLVTNTVEYFRNILKNQGSTDTILIGDIVTIVHNIIKVDPDFEKFVEKKRLRQKYWAKDFSEYVLEQIFPQQEIK